MKLADLARRFDGKVWKHYGVNFFEAFKGVTADTKKHLLVGEGISKNGISGLHDKDLFVDLLVTQGNGAVTAEVISKKNTDVLEYTYGLYKKKPDGSFVIPKELKSGTFTKTVVKDLSKNWDKWERAATEAVDDAMRNTSFPTQYNQQWVGVAADKSTITGYFDADMIATFWPTL